MSSEMREWKFGDRVEWQDSPGNWHEAVIIGQREGHDCTEYEAILADGDRVAWYAFGRFRALLARTEAGADGAVAWILRTGHGTALHEGPRPPVEGVGWKPLFTHPQDASGDAVDWKDEYRFQRAMRYMDNNDELTKQRADEMADEDIRRIEAHAMQAKEAK